MMKYSEAYKSAIYPLKPEVFSSERIRNYLGSSHELLKGFHAGTIADEGFVECLLMVGSLVDNKFHRKADLDLQETELFDVWNETVVADSVKWAACMKKDVRTSLEKMIQNWRIEVNNLKDVCQGMQLQLWDEKSEQIVNVENESISIEHGYKIIFSATDYMVTLSTRNAFIGYEGLARYYEADFSSLLDMLDSIDREFKEITEECGDEVAQATGATYIKNAYFWQTRKPKSSVFIQV